jgi:hypothetical protein
MIILDCGVILDISTEGRLGESGKSGSDLSKLQLKHINLAKVQINPHA